MVDAILLGGNVLCYSPDCGLVTVGGAVGSSAAAGTDVGGTMDETVSDAGLACGRNREGLPAGGRGGGEQYYEVVSWRGLHTRAEQMESRAWSRLFDSNVDCFPGHMDPWLHLPGLQSMEAWL